MPASRSATVETSYTKKVKDALDAADDFMTLDMIVAATKLSPKSVRPTLWWLQKAHAVESLESSGRLWWFSTPDADTRTKVINEHRKEDEPRRASPTRTRKPRVTKVKF